MPTPDLADLYEAQDAPLEADRAGASEPEYQQLVAERQEAEIAFLEAYDNELARGLEAEADDLEPEAEP